MARGDVRIAWIVEALRDAGLDALLCTLPTNVLLLSGYWPVVGSAVAAATRDGRIAVLAPADEQELATQSWASDVRAYEPSSLDRLSGPADAVREPLGALLRDLGVAGGRIGYEDGPTHEQSSYAAMFLFQSALPAVLAAVVPAASRTSGAAALTRLRSRLAEDEVSQVRLACQVARDAFIAGARGLRAGLREPEVAAAFGAGMSIGGLARPGVRRAGAFTFCMSGPHAAQAKGAYAYTRDRTLRAGDFVLVHCNSYVDGYWTDITRTYCLGEPDERQRAMYDAVFAARSAALAAIRPGVRAAEVDRAARDTLTERGFGQYFPHPLGHNVGLSAISAEYPPRLSPPSPDTLEVGMTFNCEPAIYIDGYGGLRHCDVVTVRAEGPEVLTLFQSSPDDLSIISP